MNLRAARIVGAGIAGLTAALCFARRGIACDVFEQAEMLEEVGAGLQLSPNASRILQRLGLLPELEERWNEPERVTLASGFLLKPIATVPLGKDARRRWGAPYGVLHRASLQRVLLDAVRSEPLCNLVLGSKSAGKRASAPGGRTGHRADLTIGADGVWSSLRQAVPGAGRERFSGNVAWRFMLPFREAPDFLDANVVSAFLGPRAHLVVYPLTQFDAFNIVAIHQASSPGGSWSSEPDAASRARLRAAFSGWNEAILDMLERAASPRVWPLHECGDGRWFDGHDLVLIGDAAHAMTPFAAQGAAMAIEDAAELAAATAGTTDMPSAIREFETRRRARVNRVRSRAAFNRFAYHARGPLAFGRDLVLSFRRPEDLASDFDWLYGYTAAD